MPRRSQNSPDSQTPQPRNFDRAAADYRRVEIALQYIANRFPVQPGLGEIAGSCGLSEAHFQRLFSRWVGLSPQRFFQYLSKEHARQALAESQNLLEATDAAHLSSSGRLHDLMVRCEAATPAEVRSHGRGLRIAYGRHATPFGECLIAQTERGICFLGFASAGETNGEADPRNELEQMWRNAELHEAPAETAPRIEQIFGRFLLESTPREGPARLSRDADQFRPLPLLLKGTNFQMKVWEALLRIPSGRVLSYADVARLSGRPTAVRAVAGAVANNPIALVIPCHRVIRKLGAIHNYRWGGLRKQALLGFEAGQIKTGDHAQSRNAVASR